MKFSQMQYKRPDYDKTNALYAAKHEYLEEIGPELEFDCRRLI